MSLVLSVCLAPYPSLIPGGPANTGPSKGPAAPFKYEGRMRMMMKMVFFFNFLYYRILSFCLKVLLSAQLNKFGSLPYA